MAGVDSEQYWDERARENALFFVDTTVGYDSPDADAFWRHGHDVVEIMTSMVGLTLDGTETVLDIGCGVGRLTRALAARTKYVCGIDVSNEMLALAKQHNADLDNVQWIHGDGKSLDGVGDSSVDGCFSHVVFQHIPDPTITLDYVREMGRVLRPGGWALFQVSTDPVVHQAPKGRRERIKEVIRMRERQKWHRAWWGSAVEVEALRAAARDGRLEVKQVLGAGTQYTTVLLRRPGGSGGTA